MQVYTYFESQYARVIGSLGICSIWKKIIKYFRLQKLYVLNNNDLNDITVDNIKALCAKQQWFKWRHGW